MARRFLFITLLLLTTIAYGQKSRSIELNLFSRYDKHADYTTRFFDRSYTNDTKLWGKSFGVNFNYVHLINKQFNARIGIGYYNLGIDEIRQTTPFNLIAIGRNIDYSHPIGIEPLFGTKKYHYDNLNFVIGIDYVKPLRKRLDFVVGGDLTYLYSISQLYHIAYDNIRHRTNKGRALGIAANTLIGVSHKFNKEKNYLSPKLIIPIYQQLRGDKIFGEDKSVKMDKWFNGAGLSITLGRYF